MSFIADKQTLTDLNIPGRFKHNSISRLFDVAVTTGGKKLMDNMFQFPLTEEAEINKRSSIFKYFANAGIVFPFTGEEFNVMEIYLSSDAGNWMSVAGRTISKRVLHIAAQATDYETLNQEVCNCIQLLNRLQEFIAGQPHRQTPYSEELNFLRETFANPRLSWLLKEKEVTRLSLKKLIKYDHLLRSVMHGQMLELLERVHRLDVNIAVGKLSAMRGFCFAQASPKECNELSIQKLYHPAVDNAIGNNLSLDVNCNVIFLTGANMAGKSTLMKSFGIAIYLAHMGFPVAASNMRFSVKDGLYSSINVSDDLGLGHSHFYAEVLRVKTVAEEVAADKSLVVIFDELFKGTNVKDAYDATLAITAAFAENRNCFFIISTHIVEVGETLRQQTDNFRFTYLPTIMKGVVPQYTYTLTEGITTDRHGMMIIENEGILDIIKGHSGK
jgi:DNA mismatch repair protein MutS